MRVSINTIPGLDQSAQLCDLHIEGEGEKQEVSDLIESLTSFQTCCKAGFFTTSRAIAVEERYIQLTFESHGRHRQWDLSRRKLNAGIERILLRVLLRYETGENQRLVVKMPEPIDANDDMFEDLLGISGGFTGRTSFPFELRWDWVMPLGKQPVIRIEFDRALTPADTDEWFCAIRAWEHIVGRQGFGDPLVGKATKLIPKQLGWSQLFLLSPNWLEYSLYGFEIDIQALTSLFRFLIFQWHECRIVRTVEIQR